MVSKNAIHIEHNQAIVKTYTGSRERENEYYMYASSKYKSELIVFIFYIQK